MTIDIPDQLAEELIAIGKELAHQDNLATAWPIWYVTELKRTPTTSDRADGKERLDVDMFSDEFLCESCRTAQEEGELPEDCDNWECNESFYYYEENRVYASYGSCFFLTQKACQEYIDDNAYHFFNPQPYAGSAHRNYEIQPVIQALILMAGEKVPSNHYGHVTE